MMGPGTQRSPIFSGAQEDLPTWSGKAEDEAKAEASAESHTEAKEAKAEPHHP